MSEIQETDVVMRIAAVTSGVIALIEAILRIMGTSLVQWGWGPIGDVLAIFLAILVILLGIKPIHYTPTFLGILGIGTIILGVLIGGIIILVATILGVIT